MSIATTLIEPMVSTTDGPTGSSEMWPRRHLVAVPQMSDQVDCGGIWIDPAYAAEAGELAVVLRGLARLESEILSI